MDSSLVVNKMRRDYTLEALKCASVTVRALPLFALVALPKSEFTLIQFMSITPAPNYGKRYKHINDNSSYSYAHRQILKT